MFRLISIICLAGTVGLIWLHWLFSRPGVLKDSSFLQRVVFLLTLFFVPQRLGILGIVRKLAYLLGLLCFVILLVTAFASRLVCDVAISSYWLMIHATASGIFAACMAILAITYAPLCRLDDSDWQFAKSIWYRQKTDSMTKVFVTIIQKLLFWAIVVLSLPLILSIVLSMFPIFGTHGQELLFETHRYTALVFTVCAMFHTYLLTVKSAYEA